MLFAGELVKPKSGGLFTHDDFERLRLHGEFWAAFDILAIRGESVGHWPTAQRAAYMVFHAAHFDNEREILAESFHDGTAIDRILADGGEGLVRCEWSAPYGSIVAAKAGDIFLCKVTSTGGSQSVGICDSNTGADRGRVKLGGGRCDQVRVGSLIRVAGMNLTDDGKIRQPTACREWLVQY